MENLHSYPNLVKQIRNLKAQIECLNQEKKALEGQIKKIQTDYSERLDFSNQKLKQQKQKIDHWLRTIFRKQRKELVQEINELEQAGEGLLKIFYLKEKEYADLEQAGLKLLTAYYQKEQEIQDQKQKISQLSKRIASFRKQRKYLVNERTKERKNYKIKINNLQNVIQHQAQEIKNQQNIIQTQAERIRELENKPPLVNTETICIISPPLIKEKEKIIEKPVNKIIEVENPCQKEEIEWLKSVIADLKWQLINQPSQIKIEKEKIEVP
ncbi:MAG: hypothetical protein I3274_07430, partial [Candidatus Moeniiplasma glomeromycotorum]|nr:hypothetical protein [Candidatus Moeniiplasma glomeromycotorum]